MYLPNRDLKTQYCLLVFSTVVFLAVSKWWSLWVGCLGLAVSFSLFVLNRVYWRIPTFPYDVILSAHSADGLVWNREIGVRLGVGGIHKSVHVYYPRVIPIENGWRMYYRAGGYQSFIASAVSDNALDWSEEKGIRIGGCIFENKIGRIDGHDVLHSSDGSLRMYFSAFERGNWRIYYSQSLDGLVWSFPEVCIDVSTDENLPNVKAPNTIFFKGLFWMFFSRFSFNSHRISASVSEDGETWSKCRECEGLDSNGLQIYNPHVNMIEGGQLRLYFTDNTHINGPVGAVIRSAVSYDGIHWSREEGVRIGPGLGYDKHGISNVHIVPIESGYRMYYTGYWGRHLLEPLTLRYYRKRR